MRKWGNLLNGGIFLNVGMRECVNVGVFLNVGLRECVIA